MVRAVIVGQSFNENSNLVDVSMDEWSGAFLNPDGYSTKVLLGWLGISYGEFKLRFDTYNVFNRRGEHIPDDLKKCIKDEYSIVMLLGRVAAKEILGQNHSQVPAKMNKKFYIFPHPSGKNRVLNNKKVCDRCCAMGHKIMKELF